MLLAGYLVFDCLRGELRIKNRAKLPKSLTG